MQQPLHSAKNTQSIPPRKILIATSSTPLTTHTKPTKPTTSNPQSNPYHPVTPTPTMDPTNPSQLPLDEAYHAPSNPTTKTPSEMHPPSTTGPPTTTRHANDIRIPSTQTAASESGTPSALGRGPSAPGPDRGEAVGPAADTQDGEQMRVLGEGEVYEAQLEKREKGGFGEEKSLTEGLERKMEEQRGRREEGGVEGEGEEEVDVKGALGGRGGVVAV